MCLRRFIIERVRTYELGLNGLSYFYCRYIILGGKTFISLYVHLHSKQKNNELKGEQRQRETSIRAKRVVSWIYDIREKS